MLFKTGPNITLLVIPQCESMESRCQRSMIYRSTEWPQLRELENLDIRWYRTLSYKVRTWIRSDKKHFWRHIKCKYFCSSILVSYSCAVFFFGTAVMPVASHLIHWREIDLCPAFIHDTPLTLLTFLTALLLSFSHPPL